MQYILTQEELESRVMKTEVDQRDLALEHLRRMVVSDEACKKTKRHGYCDECPLAQASFDSTLADLSRLFCDRPKSFSK